MRYPALAVYNAGGALFRSLGDTKTTMCVSIAANIVNVVGNHIGVFVLRAGLDGVLWSMPVSDVLTAVVSVIIILLTYRELGAGEKPPVPRNTLSASFQETGAQ